MLHSVWDLVQQFQISENKGNAENAQELAITSSTAISHVQCQLDTLVLANQAMWEILSLKLGVTEADLVKRMNEIDLRDGKQDGKISKTQVVECKDCGHKIKKQRSNCYWCGSKFTNSSFFHK
jgi:hypothetical protein